MKENDFLESVIRAKERRIAELESKLDSANARIEWFIQQLDIEQDAAKAAQDRLDGAIYLLHCLKESIPGIEHDDLHKRVLLFLDGVVETQSIKSGSKAR
jgi:hypothetical protein